MKRQLFPLIALCLFCSNVQSQDDAGLTQYDRYETRSSEYIAYVNECSAEINSTEDAKTVRKEMLYLDKTDKKIELSTNSNKLREQQKDVLKRYIQDVQKCRDKTNEMLIRLPQKFVNLILSSHDNMDEIFINLLTDKITISEANIKKSQLATKLNSDLGLASTELQSKVSQSQQDSCANARQNMLMFCKQSNDAMRPPGVNITINTTENNLYSTGRIGHADIQSSFQCGRWSAEVNRICK
jgi:hypothetical protein